MPAVFKQSGPTNMAIFAPVPPYLSDPHDVIGAWPDRRNGESVGRYQAIGIWQKEHHVNDVCTVFLDQKGNTYKGNTYELFRQLFVTCKKRTIE